MRRYRRCGDKKTVILADRLKDLGYHYATKAGISICIDDMTIPPAKKDIIKKAREEVVDTDAVSGRAYHQRRTV